MWTKEELRTILLLWDQISFSELAEKLDITHFQLHYMVKKMNKNGFNLQRKRNIGRLDSMLKELKAELTDNG